RKQRPFLALALVVWSPALLAVDHVHFQYNGFLIRLLLLSLHFLEQRWDLIGGVVFACLLCSKHLFLVAAPVYFMYLLMLMGSGVAAVFAAAFVPFVYYGQKLLSGFYASPTAFSDTLRSTWHPSTAQKTKRPTNKKGKVKHGPPFCLIPYELTTNISAIFYGICHFPDPKPTLQQVFYIIITHIHRHLLRLDYA
ncbi:hypothetical protein ACJX0J_041739, partial [Zea mays]